MGLRRPLRNAARLGRRGIIFSLITLVISAFLLLSFYAAVKRPPEFGVDAARTRVSTMDSFVRQWDAYVEDATRTATWEALYGMTADNAVLLVPVPSLLVMQRNISGCLLTRNNTLVPFPSPPRSCYFDENRSLIDRLDRFVELGKDSLGIDVAYEIGNPIIVEDFAPFKLRVRLLINTTIRDAHFAKWNYTKQHDVIVGVEGLHDPMLRRVYASGSFGSNPGFFNRTIRIHPVPRAVMNRTHVQDMITNRTFAANPGLAPTYLERLAGRTFRFGPPTYDTGNAAGIESFINQSDLTGGSPGGSPWQNVSYTDHQILDSYVHSEGFRCGVQVLGINNIRPAIFRLDVAHLASYGINDTDELNFTCS